MLDRFVLKAGRAENLLTEISPRSLDALIVDPPYCSGGTHHADRLADPTAKYEQSDNRLKRPSFDGDNRDQRSFVFWMTHWLSLAYEATRQTGYVMVFTDWRQLPTVTDAVQAAGFCWRGIIVWDKTSCSRAPHKGYARHQCEYVVWGTRGACRKATHDGPIDGAIRCRVNPKEKYHLAGKPVEVMEHLVRLVEPGGLICDPFMGSGSTGVAAIKSGRQFIGFDVDPENVTIAQRRIRAV